jgi:hypothetical protein
VLASIGDALSSKCKKLMKKKEWREAEQFYLPEREREK